MTMTRHRVFLANFIAVILAITLGLWFALPIHSTQQHSILKMGRAGAGPGFIVDATQNPVPRRFYQRILSTSLMTDRILLELIEPKRILALSSKSTLPAPLASRAQGKPIVHGLGPVEALLALHPDLVLMSSIGSMKHTRQLREAGVTVFELGELRGLRTFRLMVSLLGELLGETGAATEYLLDLEHRLQEVSQRRGSRPRIPGLYLSILGSELQGGTVGTSFHDVLETAGVLDVAATQFQGWPTYTAEELLALKPQLIVTRDGMGENLCRHPGLNHLPACRGQGPLVELPGALLDDPGASIIEAADRLSQAIFPSITHSR